MVKVQEGAEIEIFIWKLNLHKSILWTPCCIDSYYYFFGGCYNCFLIWPQNSTIYFNDYVGQVFFRKQKCILFLVDYISTNIFIYIYIFRISCLFIGGSLTVKHPIGYSVQVLNIPALTAWLSDGFCQGRRAVQDLANKPDSPQNKWQADR